MIYIDVGCHNGESIRDFYNGKFLDIAVERSIGIDPLTGYHKEWEEITKQFGTEFINKAAYVHNGDIDFSEKKKDIDVGSSVMRDKADYENAKIHKVECFDFVEWLAQFKEREVVIRMDIEGAEYPIIQKLLDTGIINRIYYLGVEFHARKMDEKYRRDENRIIKGMQERKISFKQI